MRRNKIFLFGYHGRRNIGDDVVCVSLVKTLEKLFKFRALLYVYTNEKYIIKNFVRENGSDIYFTSSFASNLKALMGSQTVIIGGGDYLDDYGHFLKRLQIFAQLFAFGILTKISAKKFLIINGGFRARTRIGLVFIKIILGFTYCVSTKDGDSLSLLLKYVNKRPEKGFDTAVLLDYSHSCQRRAETEIKNIGLSITPVFSNFFLKPYKDEALAKAIARTVENLVHNMKNVNFCFLALNTDVRVGDLKLIRKIMLMLDEEALRRVKLVAYNGNISDFISKCSQLDAIVCCKLHSIIFSYMLQKPMIVINYHPKNAGLAREIGLSSHCLVSLEDVFTGKLGSMISALVNTPEEFRDRLPISEARERAFNGVQKCMDCVMW